MKIQYNRETKSFSTKNEKYYVVPTASPMSGGGSYSVITEDEYLKRKERFQNINPSEARKKLGITGESEYWNFKGAKGPFTDKQEAKDEKLRLTIKQSGKRAGLTKNQRARAKELGLL